MYRLQTASVQQDGGGYLGCFNAARKQGEELNRNKKRNKIYPEIMLRPLQLYAFQSIEQRVNIKMIYCA